MLQIDRLIEGMYKVIASDLHLKVGFPPVMRVSSKMTQVKHPPLTDEDMDELVKKIMPEHLQKTFPMEGSTDFAYEIPAIGRCRVAAFHTRGHIGFTLRRISTVIPNLEDLGLPEVVLGFSEISRGLFLVTGITGSGKSTTLAATLNRINNTRRAHIITVEDPIEYLFPDGQCLINQMQVGMDCGTFGKALRQILRCDPDIILIGEMRDRETVETAIEATDTGHMVFSTLHTSDAKQTINRILHFFTPDEEKLVLDMLSMNLHAIISQRLVPRAAGGMIPACEILINTPIVSKLIREGRIEEMQQVLKNGEKGMQSFDISLANLVRANTISLEYALGEATDEAGLRRMIRGEVSQGDRAGLIGGR